MSVFINWTWGDINAGEVGPGMFSWFHILWLIILVAVCVVICKTLAAKHDPATDRRVIGVFAAILLLGELFKQMFWYAYYETVLRFSLFSFAAFRSMYLCLQR